jgi:hypothetical protein
MPRQYFDTANYKKFQCDFGFIQVNWKSISQDWSGANVANIWSSRDLYQLLISNQLLIKSNPNKRQYKSNWCLIRVVSARERYLAETLSYNWNLRLIQRRKTGFSWQKNFWHKKAREKVEFKITGVIIMNLEIFGENFMIFGQVELLK